MRGVVVVQERAGGGEEFWVRAFVALGVAVWGVGGCCFGGFRLEVFELRGGVCDCGGLLVGGRWLCCWGAWCYRCGVDLRWVASEEVAEALG